MSRCLSYYLLYWCCLLAAGTGSAQEQLLSLDYFEEDKGLNITGLTDIRQDHVGFLWLGTREGLVRFDGYTFRYFRHLPGDSTSISSNSVACLTEDPDGNIWVGLVRGGVSRYDRSTGQFRNYRFTDALKLRTATVTSIFFDRDKNIWLGLTGYGIVQLDAQTGDISTYDLVTVENAPFVTPEEVPNFNVGYNFWQDENGKIWCATTADIYQFDPETGKAESRRMKEVAPGGFNSGQAYTLFPEGDLLWVGGWASGLRSYNLKNGEWKQYLPDPHSLTPGIVNIVNSIVPKNEQEFWITGQDKGLGIFNKTTGKFFYLADDPDHFTGLPAEQLTRLCKDYQGNLWVSHEQRLLRIQLKENDFHFTRLQSDGPKPGDLYPPSVMLDDVDGKKRYIGLTAAEGLVVMDKETGKLTTPGMEVLPSVLEDQYLVVDLLQDRQGTVWVLGRHLLYRYNVNTGRLEVPRQPPLYSSKIGTNLYTQITEDLDGNIWLGTSLYGVFRYDPVSGETTHYMPDEHQTGAIATNVVGSVAADGRGRVWFGSRDKTIYGYYEPRQNRFFNLDAEGKITSELTSLRLNSFFADRQGDIWACTEQGLWHFDCSGDTVRLLKKYTIEDGLSSDYVARAVEDDKGRIWVAPARGLCRLDPGSGQITAVGRQDGIPPAYRSLGRLSDGDLFLLAENGYYRFQPDSIFPARNTAPLVLTSFRIDDRELYQGSEPVPGAALEVPAGSHFFSMEFTALNLANPELNTYEYQLSGFDEQWMNAGNRHFVNYTNIPDGQYTFRVKLAGAPDSEALSVPLIVHEAFYRMVWFRLLLLTTVMALIFSYLRHRQEQKQQMAQLQNKAYLLEKEKALVQYESLKQQLNPHFLFNSLSSLGSLISIDPKSASGFLDSLSKTYRYILKSSEREVVPLQEELKFAEAFVKLQKTRFGEGLQVRFNLEAAYLHLKIVPVTLQNLLENAIKHNIIDEESPLVVDVFIADDYLVVKNNLQKKSFVETSNRRGLANLQSFYKYLSDRKIETVEDGEVFVIKIPLIH